MTCEQKRVKLSEILSFRTGKLDSNAAIHNGLYPFFTCSPVTLSINIYAFDTEAVLLAGNNANGVFSVKYFNGKFNAYQRTYVITPIDYSRVNVKWLYFRIKYITSELQSMSVGTATKFLTKKILNSFEIDLPSIDEQIYQADILWSLQNKLVNNASINQTLEQMAQALFKNWFVDFDPVKAKVAVLESGGSQEEALLAAMTAISGKDTDALVVFERERPEQYAELKATAELFPSAMQASELGEIPEGWRIGTICDIATFQNGYAFKGKDWTEHGFPVVKIGSVKPGFVDLKSCSYVGKETIEPLERFKLSTGDILVGMTGYVGEVGLVPHSSAPPYLNQRVGRLAPINKEKYEFLYAIVRNEKYKQFVESQAQGSAQANVSGSGLMSYTIVIPTEQLIEKFSTTVYPIVKQKLKLFAQSESLSIIRDTLLPKLLSGEITLPEAEAAVNEAGHV